MSDEKKSEEAKEIKFIESNGFPVCFPEKALLAWTRTNKREFTTYGAKRPGLFSTHNTGLHAFIVILIIALEVAATVITHDNDYTEIWRIAALVLLDFIFAIGFFYFTNGKLTLLKNHELVVTTPQVSMNVSSDINKYQTIKYVGHFILLLLAGVKIYLASSIFYDEFDSNFYLITAFYSIAAGLHNFSTGKFFVGTLHEAQLRRAEKKCRKSWGEVHGMTTPKIRVIENNDNRNLTIKMTGKHRIIQQGDKHMFESRGYLTDDDLSELIGIQTEDNAKKIIAIEGVKFQLQQINSLPKKI